MRLSISVISIFLVVVVQCSSILAKGGILSIVGSRESKGGEINVMIGEVSQLECVSFP